MKIITSKGLWVSSSFTEKFGNKDILPAKTVPAFKTLERWMTEQQIKSELGAEECTLEDLAAFLQSPPNGCDDGSWNIFYVAGCVVGVYWDSGSREWDVSTWDLDDVYWRAGRRVFSRNWHSESTFKSLTKKFDYVNSDIEPNFPLEAPRSETYKLFQFDRIISPDDAIAEMRKEGYEAAQLSELLAWEEWNEKDSVIALGSVAQVRGNRYVPELWENRSERYLNLSWFEHGWNDDYRFLAVRLVSEALSTPTLSTSDTLTLEAHVDELTERMAEVEAILKHHNLGL